MLVIELDTVPNQQLQVTIDGNRWLLIVKEANGVMAVSVTLNDVTLLSGQRVVAGTPVIPYPYLQRSGNFWFLTDNDELPYWSSFDTQTLIYMSAVEADAMPADKLAWPSVSNFKLDFLIINPLLISLG